MQISTIKNRVLKINSFLALRFSKRETRNIKIAHCKSIAILFEGDAEDKESILTKYNQLAKEFEINAKIYFFQITPYQETKHFENLTTISNNDISILGTIKSNKTKEFLNLQFDYIINLNLTTTPLEKFIISKSKAICRVGFYDEPSIEVYDFMLKQKNKTNTNFGITFENIFRHLKLIS